MLTRNSRVAVNTLLMVLMALVCSILCWSDESPRAQVSFVENDKSFSVVIKADKPIQYNMSTVGKFKSPVLDVSAYMLGKARFSTPKFPGVYRVAVEWYKAKPPVFRIRVKLSRDIKYTVTKLDEGRQVVLRVGEQKLSSDDNTQDDMTDVLDAPAMPKSNVSDNKPGDTKNASVAAHEQPDEAGTKASDTGKEPNAEVMQPSADLKNDSTLTDKVASETNNIASNVNKPDVNTEIRDTNKSSASNTAASPTTSEPEVKAAPVVDAAPRDTASVANNVPSVEQPVKNNSTNEQVGIPVVKSPTSDRLSLNFAKADLATVLRSLAMQSGVNIIVGSTVKGDVSLNLQNVTLTEALDYISTVYGVKVQYDGKTYIVHTAEQVKEGGTGLGNVDMVPFVNTGAKLMQDVLTSTFPALQVKVNMLTDTTAKMKGLSTQFVTLIGPKDDIEGARKLITQLETLHEKEKEDVYTRIYRVRHSRAQDLFSIVGWMVPTVKVYLGPRNSQSLISSKEKEGGLKFTDIDLEATSGAVGGKPSGGNTPDQPTTPGGMASGGQVSGGEGNKSGEKEQIIDDTSNTIVLVGPRIDVDKAIDTLSQLDVSKPQVMIQTKVVDLSDGLDNTFGFAPDFSNATARFEVDDRGRVNLLRTLDPTKSIDKVYSTVATPLAIDMQLKALTEKKRAKILASPKSLTMEGLPATLFIGDTLRYISSIQQTTTGVTVTTDEVEVGVKLTCNSKLAGNNEVILSVDPEVSTIADITLNAQGVALPRISKRMTTNTVRIKSGETIVIGGLIQEEVTKKVSKVPLLGDLPIFGYLFRQDSNTKNRSEVVIFVTATIVDEGGQVGELQAPAVSSTTAGSGK